MSNCNNCGYYNARCGCQCVDYDELQAKYEKALAFIKWVYDDPDGSDHLAIHAKELLKELESDALPTMPG